MGNMRKSRLSPYKQDRLTEHFVSGSTERTTASLYGVNRRTAAFIFSGCAKLSPMNWKLKAKLCLAEKLKLIKATLVADGKENVGAVLRVKSLYSAY